MSKINSLLWDGHHVSTIFSLLLRFFCSKVLKVTPHGFHVPALRSRCTKLHLIQPMDLNVNRLKDYISKPIMYPRNYKKPKKNEATQAQIDVAETLPNCRKLVCMCFR